MSPMDELDANFALGTIGVVVATVIAAAVAWALSPAPFDWLTAAGLAGGTIAVVALNVAVIVSVSRRP